MQQVHYQGPPEGEHADIDAIYVALSVLTELRIAYLVPLFLNAPSLTDRLQHAFWGGAQASHQLILDDVTLGYAG